MYSSFSELVQYWMLAPWSHFLPGVLIPALVTMFCLAVSGSEVLMQWRRIGLCILINAPYVLLQDFDTWKDGLHLIPAYAFVIIYVYHRSQEKISPLVAYASTWLSLIVTDVAGGQLYALIHPRADMAYNRPYGVWEPLAWVGGAGWSDGLFVYPIGVAIVALITLPACRTFMGRGRRLA